MRITFLTPHIGSSGGVRIIMGYAHRLAQKGHQVTVVCPMKSRLRSFFHNLVRTKPAWIDLSARLKFVAVLSEKYLPQADAIVATAWQTAGLVNTLPADRGKKFYLIQHYESLFHGNKAEVDATYRYPIRQIVVSTWLKEIMLKQFNSHAELIEDPVDLDVLYPTRSAFNKDKVIGLLSHPWEWKGTSERIECFKRAQKQIPGIKLIMFGAQPNTFNVP
ncbi:MAG TPA: glycosyltransferase family 4 protein, partial [Candidatus Omnitrophota bacterium]|nr:glycosyltransferase family 4 protein [Candidatus Omnitrophota bacterium]